jgi:hypothetical protein
VKAFGATISARSFRFRCCSALVVGCSRCSRRVELEIVRVIDTPEARHIRYRVSR